MAGELMAVWGAVERANAAGMAPGDIAQAVLEQCHAMDRMPCRDAEEDRCRVTTIAERTGAIEQKVIGPDADYVLTLGPQYELAHRQLYPEKGTTVLTIKRREEA